MDSSELKSQQLDTLLAKIKPLADYLAKLKRRQLEEQFPDGDKLLEATSTADSATRELVKAIETLKVARMPHRDYLGAQGTEREYEIELRRKRLAKNPNTIRPDAT